MYQLFARMYGSNNLPDSSNMSHDSTSVALPQTIGMPIGTVKIEDFDSTDCIFFFGQNVGVNSPRMLHQLEEVRERGLGPSHRVGSDGPALRVCVRWLLNGSTLIMRSFKRGTPLAGAVSKTIVRVTVPWVRIPPSPPYLIDYKGCFSLSDFQPTKPHTIRIR